jgi:hypothetical protein
VTDSGRGEHEEVAHERFAFDDAAYVLGALDEAERAAFESHLRHCLTCQANVAELGQLPALLERAEAAAWSDEAPASDLPDTLLPRLMWQVRSRQRRRRWRVAVLTAAAACVLALLAVLGVDTLHRSQQPSPRTFTALNQQGSRVQADVTLTRARTGTLLRIRCGHYGGQSGYPSTVGPDPTGQGDYRLVVINKAGVHQSNGSWPPGPDIDYSTMTNWPPQAISSIQILDAGGTPILQVVL